MLLGKIALITGAGNGIGRAISQILSREGARVIATDINKKNVEETWKTLRNPNDHLILEMDVSKQDNIIKSLDEIIKHYSQPPSIVVNSAGILDDSFLLNMSLEQFESVINVNLKGTFLVTQTCVKAMKVYGIQEGSVVNVASIVGKIGNPGQSNYAASKAGVEGLTKSVAKEFGPLGIRCNAVLPGLIDTTLIKDVPDKVKELFINMSAMKRIGKPEEVAEVVAFLASSKSSYVNGASIEVTGG